MIKKNYIKQAVYGFIKAIKRFDINYEVKLSTYAVPYIIGEIKRFIRDDGPIKVSRSLKELNAKIKEIQREYLIKKGEEINISEIAKILKVTKEEIAMALESQRPIESVDEESYEGEGSNETKITKISNGKDETQNLVDKICLSNLISNLDKREKQIILMRYYREKTQSEIAKMLGISQVQVSRIEKKILQNMKQEFIEGIKVKK